MGIIIRLGFEEERRLRLRLKEKEKERKEWWKIRRMWFIGTVCKFYIEWFLGAHEAQLGLAHFEAWLEPCARSYLASACLCCVCVWGCVNVMSIVNRIGLLGKGDDYVDWDIEYFMTVIHFSLSQIFYFILFKIFNNFILSD